jgi:multicomponent Na+:H+ antiporter subunit E
VNDTTSATTPATATPADGSGIRRFILGILGIFLVWLLLTGTLDNQELLTGGLVSLLCAALALPHLSILDGLRLTPALPLQAIHYLAVFLKALLLSNLDMARRVMSPALPIRPAIVSVHTDLVSPLGRLVLANSITLTPGTLSVDVLDDRILVHWIDTGGHEDLEAATRAIAADFERILKGFLR